MQLSSYAIRDAEEYKNFCDRPKDQRPLPDEVIGVSIHSFHSHDLAYEMQILDYLGFVLCALCNV